MPLYSEALLEAADCTVWGIDRDPAAQSLGSDLSRRFSGRLTMLNGRFGDVAGLLAEVGIEKETPIEDDVGGGQLPILLGQFFPQARHDVWLGDLDPPMQFNPEVGPFQFGLVQAGDLIMLQHPLESVGEVSWQRIGVITDSWHRYLDPRAQAIDQNHRRMPTAGAHPQFDGRDR